MNAPSLTLGIEEEYQIIDPATGELKSHITRMLEDGRPTLREQIKAELHQSMAGRRAAGIRSHRSDGMDGGRVVPGRP